jgi:hypothetical protein
LTTNATDSNVPSMSRSRASRESEATVPRLPRLPRCSARHGTARHGTARHGTARHGTATMVLLANMSIKPIITVYIAELGVGHKRLASVAGIVMAC